MGDKGSIARATVSAAIATYEVFSQRHWRRPGTSSDGVLLEYRLGTNTMAVERAMSGDRGSDDCGVDCDDDDDKTRGRALSPRPSMWDLHAIRADVQGIVARRMSGLVNPQKTIADTHAKQNRMGTFERPA